MSDDIDAVAARDLREAPQKPLVLQPMGATLPPGVVPAAIAWPRPGVRA